MSKEEFERQFMGVFTPDKRLAALDERLYQYYKDAPHSMPNREALPYWIEFKRWCLVMGYSQREINIAKRNCNRGNL